MRKRTVVIALGCGLAGLALSLVGVLVDPRRAAHAYLVAFLFWLGLSLGALGLLLIEHAARATWFVAIRRPIEAMAAVLPLLALLALPLLLGLRELYPWVAPGEHLSEEARHLVAHRRPYLNVPFFVARAVLYFAVWVGVSWRLRTWSLLQDQGAGEALALKQHRFGAAMLPAYAITVTFAAFDWLMSLRIGWQSTMFGVLFWAGSFVGGLAALVVVVAAAARVVPELGRAVTREHLGALGRMLFAFVCFWGYVAFAQWMLVWIADMPEEVSWYVVRRTGGWSAVGVFLIVGHFVLPFLALISYEAKRRAAVLVPVALWVLFAHYVDLWWMVVPEGGGRSALPHWLDLATLVGVGGVAVAYGSWRARHVAALPVGDPRLPASLAYEAP